jgi:hypothetical protein
MCHTLLRLITAHALHDVEAKYAQWEIEARPDEVISHSLTFKESLWVASVVYVPRSPAVEVTDTT